MCCRRAFLRQYYSYTAVCWVIIALDYFIAVYIKFYNIIIIIKKGRQCKADRE